jgi:hypothetical protein
MDTTRAQLLSTTIESGARDIAMAIHDLLKVYSQ